eukprot:INCI2743.2.p1 GENE.INCI2743.2~~INCI2743.2.p1  ORF type:complete len:438 (-),score=73.77 INCI2743.2:57-1214(-)
MSDGQMRTGSMMQRAWGQIVVGPPGAGKTTYCQGMKMFMEAIERDAIVVNLDPANKETPYKCTVNITDLITVEEVMETLDLGPNGALMYCIEYLEANIDWLLDKLKPHMDRYMLFDCPGQIELFTHNPSLAKIIQHLTKTNLQLCCVHLTDSHHCSDVAKYISATLVSLMVMLKLELPHVNVLSKIDLLEKFGPLELGLNFFANGVDLVDVAPMVLRPGTRLGKLRSEMYVDMTTAICEQIDNFHLVAYHVLNIEDKVSVARLLREVDKAIGFMTEFTVDHVAKDASAESQYEDSLNEASAKYMSPTNPARVGGYTAADAEEAARESGGKAVESDCIPDEVWQSYLDGTAGKQLREKRVRETQQAKSSAASTPADESNQTAKTTT